MHPGKTDSAPLVDAIASEAVAAEGRRLPRIVLLGTGGTIAAAAPSATRLHDYTVEVAIDDVLAAVPQVGAIADVRAEQVVNVDSRDIGNDILLRIARRAAEVVAEPEVDGVVIAHGTDTLEETAYFLNLVLKTAKPVVVVGAMRPATALSADGPLNLYHAFLIATHPDACGRGVMVSVGDHFAAARFVTKAATTEGSAFRSLGQGNLGEIAAGQVHFYGVPARRHTLATEFSLADIATLPPVDILYDHQGAGVHLYRASIAAGARGLVIAGTGNGSLSPAARQGAQEAVRAGLAVVRSSRVGAGIVTHAAGDDALGLVAANSLNPQKARILLMLALGRPRDLADLRRCFECY